MHVLSLASPYDMTVSAGKQFLTDNRLRMKAVPGCSSLNLFCDFISDVDHAKGPVLDT